LELDNYNKTSSSLTIEDYNPKAITNKKLNIMKREDQVPLTESVLTLLIEGLAAADLVTDIMLMIKLV
jgi:hypothetical protein